MEDFADPNRGTDAILDMNTHLVSGELRHFLLHPQAGARKVARHMFGVVSNDRKGHYSMTSADLSGDR